MTEIEYLESSIREKREEANRLRKKEQNEAIARELHSIYESLVVEGFTEEQAFEIFMTLFKKAWENS